MAGSIRLRTRTEEGLTRVSALIRHPMQVARRDPVTGVATPAHFIEEVVCELNGRVLLTAHLGPGVARNPYLSFAFRGGRAGDTLTLRWRDNQGAEDRFDGALA